MLTLFSIFKNNANVIFCNYAKDMKTIVTNKCALIIILGLILLPPLYAWFNIEASWDPYGNTYGLKIAVVNYDKGADLNDKHINAGNEVMDNIRENKDLGWQFYKTRDEAIEDLKMGKLYAAVVIPDRFSSDLISVITEEPQKAQLEYYENNKLNAIAPKIMSKGASSLQEEINRSFIEATSAVALGTLKNVGIELNANANKLKEYKQKLYDFDALFPVIIETVDTSMDILEGRLQNSDDIEERLSLIEHMLDIAIIMTDDINDSLGSAQNHIDASKATLDKNVVLIESVLSQSINMIIQYSDILSNDSSNSNMTGLNDRLDAILDNVTTAQSRLGDYSDALNKISAGGRLSTVSAASERLNTLSQTLAQFKTGLESLKNSLDNIGKVSSEINKLADIATDLQRQLKSFRNDYDTIITPALTALAGNANDVNMNANALLKLLKQDLSGFKTKLAFAAENGLTAVSHLRQLQSQLPQMQQDLHMAVAKIRAFDNSYDLDQMIDILLTSSEDKNDFFANPTELKSTVFFPIPNYGSASAPFFTVLAIWVGALLLSSMLKMSSSGDFTATQQFWSKHLLFLTVSLLQAFVVTLGDLLILKVYVADPVLFVLLGMVISFVFSMIVFSLVTVFGNVGKAMGVILLVLQLSASGGTFPIEVTPGFFQAIHPFLPFTYAINAMREASGGVVPSLLVEDVLLLFGFYVIFAYFGIKLKQPINKLGHGFVKKLKESSLFEG